MTTTNQFRTTVPATAEESLAKWKAHAKDLEDEILLLMQALADEKAKNAALVGQTDAAEDLFAAETAPVGYKLN